MGHEKENANYCLGLRLRDITPIMENQMEKNIQ